MPATDKTGTSMARYSSTTASVFSAFALKKCLSLLANISRISAFYYQSSLILSLSLDLWGSTLTSDSRTLMTYFLVQGNPHRWMLHRILRLAFLRTSDFAFTMVLRPLSYPFIINHTKTTSFIWPTSTRNTHHSNWKALMSKSTWPLEA